MDFQLTPDQVELRDMVRDFVEKEITPHALEMDKDGVLPPGLIEKMGE